MENNQKNEATLERLQASPPNIVESCNERIGRIAAQHSLHNIAGLSVGNVSYSAHTGKLNNTITQAVIGRPVN